MPNDHNADKINVEFMKAALKCAEKAFSEGEVPVGAVIVDTAANKIIAQNHNTREKSKNALKHAELAVIGEACRAMGGWRLHMCDIYVTLEPCPMCAGAIINARLKRVIFGVKDYKAGAFGSVLNLNNFPLNHKPIVIDGICETESRLLLQKFFLELRQKKQKNQ